MQRAAIYARFSSDRQNERSCQDQIDLCAAWAEKQGIEVVATFADHAISGASTINRLEFGRMRRAARNREFDVVISEALDRISRDQADLATIKKQLAFEDVSIMTVQDGEVGAMHIGPKGLMGEMFLADLAQKTRRGQRARVKAGAVGGGRSYGYEPVPGRPGEMTIKECEAAIVRRIFAMYVSGKTPRAIAATLNAEGVPGPRGGRWNASTINGSRARQNGIIANALYSGEIVWNRQRFIKDPATGKRVSRLNPPEEWIRTEAPQHQIVDLETFIAANAAKSRKGFAAPRDARAPRYIFSGLIKCTCGSSFVVNSKNRLGCSRRRETGTCDNATSISRHEVEDRVLAALETELADPATIAEFVREYQSERRRLVQEASSNRHEKEARAKELRVAIERIVDRFIAGTAPEPMIERMEAMELERKQLEAELAAEPWEEPIQLHPGAAENYRKIATELRAHLPLEGSEAREEMAGILRQIIEKIEVGPRNGKGPAPITVFGAFGDLLRSSSALPLMVGNVGCGSRI